MARDNSNRDAFMNHERPHVVVNASDAERMSREAGVDVPALMTQLLPRAAQYAKPPVSNFHVGAVARGLSGSLYFGCNIEFAGEALSFTVHAEQSAISNAWMNGEEGVDLIAVTAPPCGYCRQFLNELKTAEQLVIQIPNVTMTLSDLLPHAFGPRDLGIAGGLMQRDDHGLVIDNTDELAHLALDAANRSYAPYSKSFAGAALRTSNGITAAGSYGENAAFNPSISPLEVALSQLNLAGGSYGDIIEAALVGVDDMHVSATRSVLDALGFAPLRIIRARNSR